MSHLVQEQLDQLTALPLIAHGDEDLNEEPLLLTCGAEDDAACLLPPVVHFSLLGESFALISWMKKGPVFDCSTARLFQIASCYSFLSFCAVSRGLLREAGEEVRVQGHELLGNFVQGRVPM